MAHARGTQGPAEVQEAKYASDVYRTVNMSTPSLPSWLEFTTQMQEYPGNLK